MLVELDYKILEKLCFQNITSLESGTENKLKQEAYTMDQGYKYRFKI